MKLLSSSAQPLVAKTHDIFLFNATQKEKKCLDCPFLYIWKMLCQTKKKLHIKAPLKKVHMPYSKSYNSFVWGTDWNWNRCLFVRSPFVLHLRKNDMRVSKWKIWLVIKSNWSSSCWFIHSCAAVTYCHLQWILNKPDKQSLQYSLNPLHRPRWEWIVVPIWWEVGSSWPLFLNIYNKDSNGFACYTEQMHNIAGLTCRTGHDATVALGQGSHHASGRFGSANNHHNMIMPMQNINENSSFRLNLHRFYVQENIYRLKCHGLVKGSIVVSHSSLYNWSIKHSWSLQYWNQETGSRVCLYRLCNFLCNCI